MRQTRTKAFAQAVDDYCEFDKAIKELEQQKAVLREKLLTSKQVVELGIDEETVLEGINHKLSVSEKVKETKVNTALAFKVIPASDLPLVATFSITSLRTLFKSDSKLLDQVLVTKTTETRRLKVLG